MYLEGQADIERVLAQLLDGLLVGSSHDGAAHDGRLEQRCGLVVVDVLQHVQTNLLVLALDVDHLAGSKALGTNGTT